MNIFVVNNNMSVLIMGKCMNEYCEKLRNIKSSKYTTYVSTAVEHEIALTTSTKR